MDLGVSSYQLDEGERGFSYMKDAPLDMRMNRDNDFSAYDIVNGYSEAELFKIIKDYGEEKFAKRIANFIVNRREEKPIETTLELVDIIKSAIPAKARREGPHPAKRTFQAIRIEVNGELRILNKAIEDGVSKLNKGGRMAIITFHSLEDRIVKLKFRNLANPCTCPKEFPVCICGKEPLVKLVKRKAIEPTKLAKEQKTKKKTAALQIALVIFVLGVGTIWRDTKVYSLQSQIGGLNDEIKTVNAENEALKVDLLKNSSLKNIEANAKNKLGMITPVDAEKVDVDLSKNYLEGAENNGVEEESNNNGLLSKIMDVLK